MRRAPLLLLLLVLPLALVACGGDATSLDPVAKAADKTEGAKTVHMTMTMTMRSPQLEQPVTMRSQGDFDNEHKLGRMTLDMSAFAKQAPTRAGDPSLWKGEEVVDMSDGLVVYMRLPVFTQQLHLDKPWLKMDVEKLGKQMGVDISQFTQLGGGNASPMQSIGYLRTVSGDVESVGKETVDGVQTTHYKATVDLRKYPKLVPEDQRAAMRASVDKIVQIAGRSTFPVDVWVDGDDLVRRMAMTMPMTAGQGQSFESRMDMRFSGFDEPVDVDVPDESQTTDFATVMQKGRQG